MRNLMRGLERVILLVILLTLPAKAEWVTIRIEGVIEGVSDYFNILEGKVDVCDTFTGWYTYDTSTPDTSINENESAHVHNSQPAGVHIDIGGLSFESDPENLYFAIGIANNYLDDGYGFSSHNIISNDESVPVQAISWWLTDPTGNAISSTALTTEPPILENWLYNNLYIGSPAMKYEIQGHVTSAIPEPATLLLLAIGSFGLCERKISGRKNN